MWKLKDFAEGSSKIENAKAIKSGLESLKGIVEELKFVEVGININPGEQAYDVVLNSEFENMEDLSIYQNHPEHVKVAEFIAKVRSERVVVDYEG